MLLHDGVAAGGLGNAAWLPARTIPPGCTITLAAEADAGGAANDAAPANIAAADPIARKVLAGRLTALAHLNFLPMDFLPGNLCMMQALPSGRNSSRPLLAPAIMLHGHVAYIRENTYLIRRPARRYPLTGNRFVTPPPSTDTAWYGTRDGEVL
jgi:hypothetical protein